jgi:DNA-binding transcriptional MerR regulator
VAEEQPRYQIGEVAERTGVTQRTLRFYEERGLVEPPERMEGGFRLYTEEDIVRIEYIKRLQDLLGFTLAEIKEMVESEDLQKQIIATFRPDRELPARQQRAERIIDALETQLEVVERKIDQLSDLRKELRGKLKRMNKRRDEIVEAMNEGKVTTE